MSGKAFMHRSAPGDLFETPYPMTRALLDRENFPGTVLEPSAGNGAIVRVLEEYGRPVVDYDLHTGERCGYRDFLEEDARFPSIITNPPYSLADEFVMKAKELRPKKFAFLLRTNYLSGHKRHMMGVYKNLARVYVFDRMPDLRAPVREDGLTPSAGIVYAWFVWVRNWRKPPQLFHVPYQEHIIKVEDYTLDYAEELLQRGIISKLPKKFREES